jgi:hypothetical protein
MKPHRDPVRAQLEWFRDSADARRRSAAGQILRSLHGGNHLTSELLLTYKDRYRKALSDLAIARALLKELDELEQFEAGEQVKP